MLKIFKTKDEALKYLKKLSFDDIRYNQVKIRKIGKEWWIDYE
jgi:hypothetical protein